MALTKHGYHIPGTVLFPEEKNISKRRCGGPKLCEKCMADCKLYWTEIAALIDANYVPPKMNEPTDFLAIAKEKVRGYLDRTGHEDCVIYVSKFSKVLQNWYAWVGTTHPDSTMYEVTYNGDKKETYIDTYVKTNNVVIPD